MNSARGDPGWGLLLIVKGNDRGDPALTKRFCGFDSLLEPSPVIPKTLKWECSLLAWYSR